jgi:hypothetical protein
MRRWLAKLLYPEVFETERAYIRLKARAADAYWWLGEFPEACATLRWLLDVERDQARPMGVDSVSVWMDNISYFREQLRQGKHLEAAKTGEWQRVQVKK